MSRLMGFVGLAVLLGIAWALSNNRRRFPVRCVLWGLGLQFAFALVILYQKLMAVKDTLSERSVTIATYALCGFANFGSMAIQIGGVSALVPEQRGELSRLSLRALAGISLATFTTACIAGILL